MISMVVDDLWFEVRSDPTAADGDLTPLRDLPSTILSPLSSSPSPSPSPTVAQSDFASGNRFFEAEFS